MSSSWLTRRVTWLCKRTKEGYLSSHGNEVVYRAALTYAVCTTQFALPAFLIPGSEVGYSQAPSACWRFDPYPSAGARYAVYLAGCRRSQPYYPSALFLCVYRDQGTIQCHHSISTPPMVETPRVVGFAEGRPQLFQRATWSRCQGRPVSAVGDRCSGT